MPFRFSWLCALLDDLEKLAKSSEKLAAAEKNQRQREIIRGWFQIHRRTIISPETDLAAVLSTFFPERRTDRVYHVQAQRILSILSRVLGLGRARLDRLKAWRSSTGHDLGSWAASIVQETDVGRPSTITIEQIDKELEQIAARCRFSSPQVRALRKTDNIVGEHELLGPIIRVLPSNELKWLIRLVLKDFGQVVLDEYYIQSQIHFLLPRLLKFQSTFDAAVVLLRKPALANIVGHTTDYGATALTTPIRAELLRPSISVKIGRPNFIKARSLKQVLKFIGNSRWSIEPKYDGEYCQIHVDLSNQRNNIQIFAKSGKDATTDRAKVHEYIRNNLKMGTAKCAFKHKCILEGELVVYDGKKKEIAPFYKIRKHVTRSGSFLGTEADSPAHPHERLMIVFYDCLAIDEEVTMAYPYTERRRKLKLLLSNDGPKDDPTPVNRSNWGRYDFTRHSTEAATKMLQKKLSDAIAQRCEGLILKPCDQPYFSLDNSKGQAGSVIKLKKDYIAGLGDTADLACIGARQDVKSTGTVPTKWTHFVIATIENKEEVLRFGTKPIYKVLESLTRPCISFKDMDHLTHLGAFRQEQLSESQDPACCTILRPENEPKIDVVFTKPFIVEVLGSGFDRPSSRNNWMLRHPRIIKVHDDRGLEDAISFDDLQRIADEAVSAPADVRAEESQWKQKIEMLSKPKRGVVVCNRSPVTVSTMTESVGTNTTTPTKSPKVRLPIMVREDSCEAITTPVATSPGQRGRDGQKLVDHKLTISPRPVLAPIEFQTVAHAQNTMVDVSNSKDGLANKNPTALVNAPPGIVQSASVQKPSEVGSRKVAGPKDETDKSTKRRRCALDSGLNGRTYGLKRARTESDILAAASSVLVRAETSPNLSTTHTRQIQAGRISGNPGESQALLYAGPNAARKVTSLLGLDGASDELLSDRQHTMHPPEMNFSAPWTDIQAHLLTSSPGMHSSPINFHTAPTKRLSLPVSSSPSRLQSTSDRKCYMTPPSTRSPAGNIQTRVVPPAAEGPVHNHASLDELPKDLRFLFKSSTIYLPPNIYSHSYLTETLLPKLTPGHITTTLAHWQRDLYPSPPTRLPGLTKEITALPIAESQALPHLQKIMLIEPRMENATDTAVYSTIETVQLVREKDERVEVWDWRVIEALAEGNAQEVPSDMSETKQRWYKGRIRWSRTRCENVFEASL